MPPEASTRRNVANTARVALPKPRSTSGIAVEAAMSARRSIRDFADQAITLAELGQLLWAAQGVTDASGGRTAPSAGATYPLKLYVATAAVEGLTPGLYHYEPVQHDLRTITNGDKRRELASAALSQSWIAQAAAIIVIAADFQRTTVKYGQRGERYAHIEAGHAGENICLQAAALGLGSTVVGAFDDAAVKAVIGADEPGEPLCLLPIGRA